MVTFPIYFPNSKHGLELYTIGQILQDKDDADRHYIVSIDISGKRYLKDFDVNLIMEMAKPAWNPTCHCTVHKCICICPFDPKNPLG